MFTTKAMPVSDFAGVWVATATEHTTGRQVAGPGTNNEQAAHEMAAKAWLTRYAPNSTGAKIVMRPRIYALLWEVKA